jgi:thiol-disulfide isomerase/thioredoxin
MNFQEWKSKHLTPKKVVGRILEIAIFILALWGVMAWQERNLLPDDGSVSLPTHIEVQRLSDGEKVLLGDELNPEKSLVYFFAPWCSICKMSAPNLNDLQNENAQVIAIALSYDSVDDVQEFVNSSNLNIPVYLGNNQISQLFNVEAFPTYYLLNKDLRIVDRSVGYSTGIGMKWRLGRAD